MSNLTWEDPTPKGEWFSHTRRDEIGAELKANPGVWARLDEMGENPTHSYRIKQGRYWGSGYESTTRRIDGTRYIFARYVGEDN